MTERYSEYDNWAWLYNTTAGPEYRAPQLAFLERCLFPGIKAGDRILDLCCGTGQLMEPLIERGFKVTGLDGSQAMLDHAKLNTPQAELILDDARTFKVSPDCKYQGVICTSASLNHIPTMEDLTAVFFRVSEALDDGGCFVFDINHTEQMRAHWRGQAAEGEIKKDFAWLITPTFNETTKNGSFRVDIYRRNSQPNPGWKRFLSQLLDRKVLLKSRLRVLKKFGEFQPDWHHSQLNYDVHGHDLNKVRSALSLCGFKDIDIQTICGSKKVNENTSAHFVCVKAAVQSNPNRIKGNGSTGYSSSAMTTKTPSIGSKEALH